MELRCVLEVCVSLAEIKADEHFACVENLISLLFNYSESIACVTGLATSQLSTKFGLPPFAFLKETTNLNGKDLF
jgi:hypothetical protein